MSSTEEEDALFSLHPEWRRLNKGRTARRTDRHRFLLSVGLHPLSLYLRRALRLHPGTFVTSGIPVTARPTCGTCVFLGKLDVNTDQPPGKVPYKCWKADQRGGVNRVSRGGATTVRRWWPACTDYEESAR